MPEPIPVAARKVRDVRFEPTPLIALDDTATAKFVVDNLRNQPLEGQVHLALPGGLSADRVDFEVQDARIDNPLTENVTLALPSQAAAYEANALLQTRIYDAHFPVPVIRLGHRGAVDMVEEDGAFIFDNGRTRFGVAPGFGATLFRWEEGGVNHTLSPYPEVSLFDWMNPWYGGITPTAQRSGDRDFPGKLHRETFVGEVVDLPDARGIPWRGVRAGADLQRERMLGLRVELDYLTVGGSNVLKVIYRVRNRTTARRHFSLGALSFWQPDGTSKHNVLHSDDMERKPNPWILWAESRHWAAVTNGETGRTLIQVSPYPNTRMIDWGTGGHLSFFADVDVPPEGAVEREIYLALCPSLAEAKRYIALKDVK
jgi:hypothetical protein